VQESVFASPLSNHIPSGAKQGQNFDEVFDKWIWPPGEMVIVSLTGRLTGTSFQLPFEKKVFEYDANFKI